MKNAMQIQEWVKNTLKEKGYELLGAEETVSINRWSTTSRMQTTKGLVYQKHMAENFSNEPRLLEFLNHQKFQNVPAIIAMNNVEKIFLMEDAGQSLDEFLKSGKGNINIGADALKLLAKLQMKSIPHVDSLIKIGVYDWRLSKLPEVYEEFILSREKLLASLLRPDEIKHLRKLSGGLKQLCHFIALLNIPETLEHGDLNDLNILIKDGNITISDFGDSSISHPFISLVTFLRFRGIYGMPMKQYESLRDIYLEQWLDYGTIGNIIEAFNQINIIEPIIKCLHFLRAIDCIETSDTLLYNSNSQKIAKELRIFIDLYKKITSSPH